MAESASYARRTMKGGCATAHIPGGLNTGVTGVVACDDLSTWVGATANGPTRLMLNRAGVGPAGSTPEEIEISTLAGNNVTIAARGLQGTSQATHPANSTIEVISSPRDLDEANQAVFQLLSKATTAGQRPYVSAAGVFTMLAPGTAGQIPVMNDAGTAPINVDVAPLSRFKQSVRAATTAALATGTYSNGVFTVTANAALAAQDGVTLIAGDRLLVKNQVTGSQNGVYTVTTVGDGSHQAVLTRAADFDLSAKIKPAVTTWVEEGTVNAGTQWFLSNTGTVTLDSTALTFKQTSSLLGVAQGDIIYFDGTNWKILPKQADGLYLKLASGIPSWAAVASATFVGARAYRTTTQTFTASTFTALALTTESYDTNAIHDTGSNTDRFTVPVSQGGKYLITAYADLSTANKAILVIYKNGVDPGAGNHDQVQAITGGANIQVAVSGVYDLAAGDYLSVYMWSDNASPSCFDAAVSFSKIG